VGGPCPTRFQMQVESGHGWGKVVSCRRDLKEEGHLRTWVESELLSGSQEHGADVKLHAITDGRQQVCILLDSKLHCLEKQTLTWHG
jgi:hypothetical protein